jgi:2-keto-4-pentenoate hydratase
VTIDEAQRELLARRRGELEAGHRHIGWKAGLDIPEIEAVSGDRPVVGYVTRRTVVADGDTVSADFKPELRAEVELVACLGCRLPAGASRVQAAASVSGWTVALELVDVTRPEGGAPAIVARNVFHVAVCLGEAMTAEPPGEARLTVPGRATETGRPARDPLDVVRRISDELHRHGHALEAGDRILTGAVVHLPAVGPGVITASAGGAGAVSVELRRR